MESPTYILNEDTQPVIRAIGVSHTACEDAKIPTKYSISQLECILIFLIMYPMAAWLAPHMKVREEDFLATGEQRA